MARIASLLVIVGPWAALAMMSCGPGVQSIYEGNVRFEHCYRLDIDVHIAPTHREACWVEWKQTYTYGQTRDRVEYAERRIRALTSGDYHRPVLEPASGNNNTKSEMAASGTPIPTSLHTSPPATVPARATDGGLPDASLDDDEEPVRPGEHCSDRCDDQWRDCDPSCELPADTPDGKKAHGGSGQLDDKKVRQRKAARQEEKKCEACRSDYRECMRRCFK